MKRWTRKLLAGLLSFGMLLQVASPLSALAADGGSAAHTLTVTVGSANYTLTSDGANVTMPGNWPLNYPTVSYNDGFVFDGKFDNNTDLLSISGSENVTIRSTGTYTVKGDLTANVASLTVKKGATTNPAIEGTADITCTGNVSISGDIDYSNISSVNKSVGKKLTVRSAQNVFIDGILNGGAEITCDTLKLNCGNGSTVRGELVVNNAREVTATAYALYGVIGDDGATGKLVLNNCTGIVKLVDEIKTYAGLIRNGSVTVDPSDNVTYYASTSADGTAKTRVGAEACKRNTYQYFEINLGGQAQPTTHTLTLKYAEAYDGETKLSGTAGEENTTTYKVEDGKELTIKAVAPDEGQWKFDGWTGSDETSEKITVTVNGNMTLTAKWVERITHTLTLKNAEAYDGETKLSGTAGEENTTTYKVEDGKELTIKAVAPDEGQWKFDGWTGSEETGEEITVTVTGDMTLTANWVVETPEPGEGEEVPYGITVTIGNGTPIKVTNKNYGHILGDDNDKLTYNPGNHTLTGTGSFGGMEVEITSNDQVDVVLSNANGAVVNGSLTVTGAKDVKVTGVSSTALIMRDATITCDGDILMDNTGSGNVLGYTRSFHGNLDVESARNVTIHGVGRTGTDEDDNNYTIYGRAKIDCSGDVEITSQNGGAVWDPVVITNAGNVTITANQRAVWDSLNYLDSSINCSGKVKITSKTAAALYEGKLTITGATDVTVSGNRNDGAAIGGAAEITCSGAVTLENKGSGKAVRGELKYTPTHTQKYEIKTGAAAASAETFYTGESGTGYTGAFDNSYINIAPASSGDATPDDTGTVDSGSDAGGAVAAVLVGSAAVWGGYEIATRVILHNILPEGAAIPANRGQLALLVWNNAGRPAPVNEPAFVDLADADTAKAAQWCVEQGIMEAKTAETFKPEGWMPKFKVIEVWNKAFPKQ